MIFFVKFDGQMVSNVRIVLIFPSEKMVTTKFINAGKNMNAKIVSEVLMT